MMDTQEKQHWLEKFETYLDASLPDEESQQNSNDVDLFRLFTELAALKAEVKIESRQVKTAIDNFQTLIALLQNNNEQLSQDLAERKTEDQVSRDKIAQPLLLQILDMRDRLAAGVVQAQSYQAGWLARLDGNAAKHVHSLEEGMDISLRRLDSLLSRYEVKPLVSVGKKLDPYSMQVTETDQRFGIEDGVVLRESRKGYLCEGRVLRLAEVTVNKMDKA